MDAETTWGAPAMLSPGTVRDEVGLAIGQQKHGTRRQIDFEALSSGIRWSHSTNRLCRKREVRLQDRLCGS